MYEKMTELDSFQNFIILENKKLPSIIWYFILFLFFFTLIVLWGAIFFEYNIVKRYLGIVVSTRLSEVKIYVEDKDLETLKNAYILRGNKKQSYLIVSISEQYVVEQGSPYREVLLKTALSNQEAIMNNVIEFTFVVRRTTVMKECIQKIKGVIE